MFIFYVKSPKILYFVLMKTEIRDSRQNKIIQIAENILFEKGFSKTTVSDICKVANCSRTTLYSHFENKENLYLAVINHSFQRFLNYFENLSVEGENGLDKFLEYSKGFIQYSRKFPKNYSIIIDFYTLLRSVNNKELHSDSARILSQCALFPDVQKNAEIPSYFLMNIIKEGQKDGSINKDIPANLLWLNVWAYLVGTSSVFNFSRLNNDISILGLKLENPEKSVLHFIRKILV